MQRITTLGISIQRSPFSETSQVVHFLTQGFGRLACLAKGAFRETNSFQGNIDLLGLSRISISRRKGGSLDLLSRRELLRHYPGIRGDLRKYACASLMAELLRKGVEEGQRIEGLFPLAVSTLEALEDGAASEDRVMTAFQGAFLNMLGYQPVLDRCVECQASPSPGHLLTAYPGRGGILCRRCGTGERERTTLSWNASRLIIESGREVVPWTPDPPPPTGVFREIWAFFELFFQYFLEKRINSYGFITWILYGGFPD